MTLLAIDRSTDELTAAVSIDGETAGTRAFGGVTARSAGWLGDVSRFLRETLAIAGDGDSAPFAAVDCFVAGLGPGSFAGVRSALAALRGLSLPRRKPVLGLPSPLAYTAPGRRTAVVGDARRSMFWTVLYDGAGTVRDFSLVDSAGLRNAIPNGFAVYTPDAARIGAFLAQTFGAAYAGGFAPPASRLAEIAARNPSLARENPLPVYLTPAVRPPAGDAGLQTTNPRS